jgi:hypothetical protein
LISKHSEIQAPAQALVPIQIKIALKFQLPGTRVLLELLNIVTVEVSHVFMCILDLSTELDSMKLTYLSTVVLIVLPAVLRVSGGNDRKGPIFLDCVCNWTATSSTLQDEDGEILEELYAERRICQKTEKIPDCQACCQDRENQGPKDQHGQRLIQEWLNDSKAGFTVKFTASPSHSNPVSPMVFKEHKK